jgi:hypothetical protein
MAICFLLCVGASVARGQGLPETGGLTALPAEKAQAIALTNPSFEEQWNGWKKDEGFSIAAQSGIAHSGKSCLGFDCGLKTRYFPYVRQTIKDVGPGIYVWRFWVKTQDVGSKDNKLLGARVNVEWKRQDGQTARAATEIFRATHDWRQEELKVYVPSDLKPGAVAVSVGRYGAPSAGNAFFDDFTLEYVPSPPVEAFLPYPNYRGFLPEDGPSDARLWVRVNESQTTEPVRIEVRRADDNRSILTKTLAAEEEHVVELDAKPWPLGRYLVDVQLGSYRYPSYLIHKISSKQRRELAVWLDSNQVLHLNGKPTFFIGFYNTTKQFCSRNEDFNSEEESARLTKIAEAPMTGNINYWFWCPGTETRRRYLGEMAKHGIWFLDTVNNAYPPYPKTPCVAELLANAGTELNSRETMDRYLSRLGEFMGRQIPNFLGWYVMDERSFSDVPRHFHQYETLRKADPVHPTYGVSNQPEQLHFWRDTLDVVGVDPYPLMNMKAGNPLTLAADWTRAAVEATHGSRPVWTVIQFFQGWSTDRWPTAEELRTMSLMAITEGARGVWYWSLGHRGLLDAGAKQEEYWQRLLSVTKELKSLEPGLVAPDAPQVVKSVSDPRIRWRARIADDKYHVFAYMPSQKYVSAPTQAESASVRFTFTDGQTVTRTFRPDFADCFAVAPSPPK